MSVHRVLAPAKINLGLFLGPTRASDGRHELVSVMQSISLADELTLELAPPSAGEDEVLCPGVPGPAQDNLAAAALKAFRAATGWDCPPLRLSIVKRIPVAAGLGGGSADAAAALRLARHASGLGDDRLLLELGGELGADVPAQIAPGRWLAAGAGEQLQALEGPSAQFGVLVLSSTAALSTAAVYAEADRLELARPKVEIERLGDELRASLRHGEPLPAASELLHNDLQRAAVSLCPTIVDALEQVRRAGAHQRFVSGSGPTVVGLFANLKLAEAAAGSLQDRLPGPACAEPVGAEFARPLTVSASAPAGG
ncbi:MAG: 4-(cytidine 5'-diphospho)-2-C-methyl-D-erythritol kinase [Solirubrobacteraceae bacterium]